MELPYLLGSTDPCPTAVAMEPLAPPRLSALMQKQLNPPPPLRTPPHPINPAKTTPPKKSNGPTARSRRRRKRHRCPLPHPDRSGQHAWTRKRGRNALLNLNNPNEGWQTVTPKKNKKKTKRTTKNLQDSNKRPHSDSPLKERQPKRKAAERESEAGEGEENNQRSPCPSPTLSISALSFTDREDPPPTTHPELRKSKKIKQTPLVKEEKMHPEAVRKKSKQQSTQPITQRRALRDPREMPKLPLSTLKETIAQ
ncbi:hypothetical protein H2248_006015 [Termitomyces sp. 'cryptogamus']|nr:hypothetical protein H2248_006015 [Termitomyces sp. 'cryptogamus']